MFTSNKAGLKVWSVQSLRSRPVNDFFFSFVTRKKNKFPEHGIKMNSLHLANLYKL